MHREIVAYDCGLWWWLQYNLMIGQTTPKKSGGELDVGKFSILTYEYKFR